MSTESNDLIEIEEQKKEVFVFGRDISSIPCFRNSFLYGISSGIVGGLSYFMFTSKTKMAFHIAYGTFFCTTISYWFYCRYKWSENRFHIGQLKSAMRPKQHSD